MSSSRRRVNVSANSKLHAYPKSCTKRKNACQRDAHCNWVNSKGCRRSRRAKSPARRPKSPARRAKSPARRTKSPARFQITQVSDKDLDLDVHADSNSIYKAFTSAELVDWLNNFDFVNATFARENGMLRVVFFAHDQYPNARDVAWDDIDCESATSTIKHRCNVGTRTKVFFKSARNLLHYIEKLNAGTVSRAAHNSLWDIILDTFRGNFMNHNMDIDVLHFKA